MHLGKVIAVFRRGMCFLVFNFSRTTAIKEHVKIIFIPVIALSYPFFCSKLEQTLHKHQEQHSRHAGDIFVFKRCIGIPKNAILCVRVVSDRLCNINGPRAQVQRDELVKRLSFGETVEFLQAEVFVL